MAFSLGSELLAAQSYQSRKPVISLTSSAKISDIPFDGTFLTGNTFDETTPFCIEHSSGRVIVGFYYYENASNHGFKFQVSDTSRNTYEYKFTINFADAYTYGGMSFCELDNGNLGLIYHKLTTSLAIRYRIIEIDGTFVSDSSIGTYDSDLFLSNLWVQRLGTSSYILTYSKNVLQDSIATSGTYSGSTNSTFTIEITTSGTQTTAFFQWKKDSGGWNGPTQATGAAQLLQEGCYITFSSGNYYLGQIYKFTVIAEATATGQIDINTNPNDGDQVTIGSTTYTFRDTLVSGGSPNEVLIDYLGSSITLQNLQCALTDTDFEGTGEGVRYGTGTTANTEATGNVNRDKLNMTALTAGSAGNSIVLTVDSDHFGKTDFSGGVDEEISSTSGGDLYTIEKRTSSNFTSWSAESGIDLSPLLPSRLKDDPSFCLLSGGDLMLFFSYADDVSDTLANLTNIYFMTSSDDGATWDTPDNITTSESFADTSNHPVAVERDSGNLYVIFTKILSSLKMDQSALGWPTGTWTDWAFELSWDSVNRKLYVVTMYTSTGSKLIQNIMKIDVDTWSVDTYWDRTTTSPNIDLIAGSSVGRFIGDAELVAVFDENSYLVNLLDGENETIAKYYFKSNATYGYVKNVDWTQYSSASKIRTVQVDKENNKLWILFLNYSGLTASLEIGYLDLTETGPSYTWNSVVQETGTITISFTGTSEMRVYPDADRIFVAGAYDNGFLGTKGGLRIWDLNGAVIDYYNYDADPQFPIWGIRNVCYYDGNLYATFYYENLYGEDDRRGLAKIDLSSRNVTYHRPTWDNLDDYEIASIELGETGKLIITCFSYGVTIYDINSDSWELYNNTTVPGMTNSNYYSFRCSAYDSDNDYIFVGYHDIYGYDSGISMFSSSGSIIQSNYSIGTYSAGWSWGTIAPIVIGYGDYDAVACTDADDTLFCFWKSDDRASADFAIKWDKEQTSIDLTPYLINDNVTIKQTIDESPGTLEFNCSHGHLFDRFNNNSLLNQTFKKGRKIIVKLGENVNDTNYFLSVGVYYVTSSTLSYKRGQYTSLSVKCEDERTGWVDKEVIASDKFNDTPQNIISSLLQNVLGISSGDIDLPTISQDYLEHQWVEENILDIINEICNRYGFFFYIDGDGGYTAKQITEDAATDHTYTNSDQLIEFTPDDNYSTNINQVIVTGQENEYNEVSTEEEAVTSLGGTAGWMTGKKDYQVWYSSDHERRVKTPRLKVIETATSIGFALSGSLTEEITEVDTDEKYVVVTVDCPDLTLQLVAALALLVGSYFIPDEVTVTFTIRIGTYTSAFACWWACNILGAVATFSYEIWGYPVGVVKYTVQGQADDLEHQTEIGYVVSQKIHNDLCYSVGDCEQLAAFEMMVVRLDRKNVHIRKVAHLQDEVGDTIVFPHPYSGDNIKIFITELQTTFKKASGISNDSGGIFHDIKGWVLDY